MKKQLSLLALSVALVPSVHSMQALDDSTMSGVTGQAGLTIEQTTTGANGVMLETGEIRYTQADNSGDGEVSLTIDGMSMRSYVYDASKPDNFGGYNTIKRIIDIDSDGNLFVTTRDVDTLDIHLGAIAIGGRRLMGGMDINVWKHAPGSYTQTEVKNTLDGAKIYMRNVMTEGSGYSSIRYENDMRIAYDTQYIPIDPSTPFESELILSKTAEGIRLDVGKVVGTMEINGLSILDENGNNVFGAGNSFGDIGFGNVSVPTGSTYVTIGANTEPGENGLKGRISSSMNIGNVYYRTAGSRLNLGNVSFTTGGELEYKLALMDNGYVSGIEARIESVGVASANLRIGSLSFSNGDGTDNTTSLGGIALSDIGLEGGDLQVGLYTKSGWGSEGLMQVISTDHIRFDFEIYDEFDMANYDDPALRAAAPKLSAEIVINDFAQEQTTNYTKKGIRILTDITTNSMDVNINNLKAGNNSTYQGHAGRIVMNGFRQGGSINIEPIH